MNIKDLDELLETLGFIALCKSLLPFSLRGWVNALGLHVKERDAGGWTRIQAGGSLRSYLDAWRQKDGDWEVKKFGEDTWSRRFAHLVEPTVEIAEFLNERVTNSDDLDVASDVALNSALQQHNQTGEWIGLPKLTIEAKQKLLDEDNPFAWFNKGERRKRLSLITSMEKEIEADPLECQLRAGNRVGSSECVNVLIGFCYFIGGGFLNTLPIFGRLHLTTPRKILEMA